ncbi:MAG: hypothetical protein J3Q66DRAFT_367766 [Benniella sp.]|nr:MAG: hypothetical protein J3Q66DRAFT_367766 [Benniella sp.]
MSSLPFGMEAHSGKDTSVIFGRHAKKGCPEQKPQLKSHKILPSHIPIEQEYRPEDKDENGHARERPRSSSSRSNGGSSIETDMAETFSHGSWHSSLPPDTKLFLDHTSTLRARSIRYGILPVWTARRGDAGSEKLGKITFRFMVLHFGSWSDQSHKLQILTLIILQPLQTELIIARSGTVSKCLGRAKVNREAKVPPSV